MEYIKVTDALRCLSDALDNRKEYLGNFLDQYGLFNLTVYVSKDDGKSLEKNAVETKLLHDWIRTRYPVQSLMQTKFVSPYHSPKVQQAIINAMHSDEFSTEYQHYWEKDTFYSNRIFDLINNKPEIVGYQFGMNTDEITASTIQNLNDQLKNQADEIATLQARITKLESQTNIAKLPYFDNSDFYTYPPELDMAIKIWYEIYQTDNLPKHFTTHSDKFTQACKNLGFKLDVTAMKERIKIVTTPQKAKEKTKNKNRQN